ncbi:MAG: mechanosensitive ion channel domain-containing protein [Spirochaetota bacterium]
MISFDFLEILKILNPFHLLAEEKREWGHDLILYIYLLLIVYLLINIVLRWIEKLSTSKLDEEAETERVYKRSKLGRRFFIIISIFLAFPVFYHRLDYLPTLLGISSAAIIISMKEMNLNFVGWILIHRNEGFAIGDRIEVDGVKGDVINIGFTRFTLLEVNKEYSIDQSTNRMVHFPNNVVIFQKVFHISAKMQYVWDELKLFFTINSDYTRIEELFTEVLEKSIPPADIKTNVKEITKKFLMRMGKVTPIVYISIENNKLLVCLRYLTHIKQKRQNRSFLSKQVLKALKEETSIELVK